MFLTIKLSTQAKRNCFEIELIYCIKMDLALNNLQRCICHKNQSTNLEGTTTPDQSEPGSNGIEGVLYISHISRVGTSQLDAIFCHIQDTHFLDGS